MMRKPRAPRQPAVVKPKASPPRVKVAARSAPGPRGPRPRKPGRVVSLGTIVEGGVKVKVTAGSLEALTSFDPSYLTNTRGQRLHSPRPPRVARARKRRG